MGPTRKTDGRYAPGARAALVLALLVALIIAAGATASAGGHDPGRALAKPARPVARTPAGGISVATPTFTWGKATRAASYELRVYQGRRQLLKKTGLKKRTWTSAQALRSGVALSRKVRGTNARGAGARSRSLGFRVTPSSAKAITAPFDVTAARATFAFYGFASGLKSTTDRRVRAVRSF